MVQASGRDGCGGQIGQHSPSGVAGSPPLHTGSRHLTNEQSGGGRGLQMGQH